MRLARLAAFLTALALFPPALLPLASHAADTPPFRWDGIWTGIGVGTTSTTLSLPGPQPFFTGSGLSGGDSATAHGTSLDLSVSRLWQQKTRVFGLEATASGGGADFTDPWPARILGDVNLFTTICSDCSHLLVNGTITSTASLRGLLGTVRPDGTLWFATLGLTRGRAALTALGSFESRPGLTTAGILYIAPMDIALHGATFGLGISRPVGARSALRLEVTQDRLSGATPGALATALGPDIRIRSTRLAISYLLRF